MSSPVLRALALGAALGLTWALAPSCSGGGGGSSGGSGLHLLPDGVPCTSNGDCQSDICAEDATSGLSFCTDYCQQQSDCTPSFTNGCCFPAAPGSGFCAPSQLCLNHGDAGLGDPCPDHDECSPDLVCVYSSDNTVNECTRPCDASHGCDNLPSVCCEPVGGGAQYNYCVVDNACGSGTTATTGASSGSTGGSTGGSGYPGGDAGPVTAYYQENGATVAQTWGVLGALGAGADTIDIPPTTRDINIQLPASLQPGVFHCDAMSAGTPDAGGLFAGVNTSAQASPYFAGKLSPTWDNLLIGLQCGAGRLANAPSITVESIDLAVTSFTPGHLATPDAGAVPGQASGTAHWSLSQGSMTLDLWVTFETPLD